MSSGQTGGNPTVLICPDDRGLNPYLELLAGGVEQAGFRVEYADPDKSPFPLLHLMRDHPQAQVLHIHWLRPIRRRVMWNSGIRFHLKLLLLAWQIRWLRLRGKRVVWTVHNQISHDNQSPDQELKVRQVFSKYADAVIFHSSSALRTVAEFYGVDFAERAHVVPHGNYIGVYPSPVSRLQARKTLGIDADSAVILFFGGVRAYKGLESLIEGFKEANRPDQRLVIAGSVFDKSFGAKVQELCADDARIILYLRSVPPEEVPIYFGACDVVALPFARTLSSGSVLLAMSQGRALLLPNTAKVLDIVDEQGAIFYTEQMPLSEQLLKLDPSRLPKMGANNLSQAELFDWQGIGKQLAKIYTGEG